MSIIVMFASVFTAITVIAIILGYQLLKRFRELSDESIHANNMPVARRRSTTRQLILHSLVQTWRLGGVTENASSTVDDSDLDTELITLRNQRLALMKTSLQYSIFSDQENGDPAISGKMPGSLPDSVRDCTDEPKSQELPDLEQGSFDSNKDNSCINDSGLIDATGSETQVDCLTPPSTFKECSICLDAYNNGERIAWSQNEDCNHVFHDECITLWLLQHDHCPLCRAKLIETTASIVKT